MKATDEPHARLGEKLVKTHRGGDFTKAPRCGAKTRSGTHCRAPAMKNGRCRMHGGKSTGPRTPEGLEISRKARWKHGLYSAELRDEIKRCRMEIAAQEEIVNTLISEARREL